MNLTISLKERLIQFLLSTFPDAQEVPIHEMDRMMDSIFQKTSHYGLDTELDLAIYTTTTYMLGEDFDTEMPAAAQILNNPNFNSSEKAALLESFTQSLFEALESGSAPVEEPRPAAAPAQAEASVADYVSMQTNSKPYQEVAHWVVERLIAGDAVSVIEQFSPNFLQQLGLPMVEGVFAQQMVPFFAGSSGIENSTTVTMTHDAFGSQGFAFYMTLVNEAGEKPFILYIVLENNCIVLANLVLNKTYADMH